MEWQLARRGGGGGGDLLQFDVSTAAAAAVITVITSLACITQIALSHLDDGPKFKCKGAEWNPRQ